MRLCIPLSTLLSSLAYACAPLPRLDLPLERIVNVSPTPTIPATPDVMDYNDDSFPRPATPMASALQRPSVRQPAVMVSQRDEAPLPVDRISRLFPSLFDFFRPLNLRGFGNSLAQPSYAEKGLRNPEFRMELSPPMPWTFCDPLCGIGDQAVDAENAFDNCSEDVKEAFAAALQEAHIRSTPSKDIHIQYDPSSTMIDEFGDFFDLHGFRYQLRGATVAYKVHRNTTNVYERHRIKLTATITNDYILSKPDAERVAREVQRQLSRDGASFLEESVVANG